MQLKEREIQRMADMITPVLVNRIKATARVLDGGSCIQYELLNAEGNYGRVYC